MNRSVARQLFAADREGRGARRPPAHLVSSALGHRPPAGVEPPRARRGERTHLWAPAADPAAGLDRPKHPDVAIEPRDRSQRPTVYAWALASQLRREWCVRAKKGRWPGHRSQDSPLCSGRPADPQWLGAGQSSRSSHAGTFRSSAGRGCRSAARRDSHRRSRRIDQPQSDRCDFDRRGRDRRHTPGRDECARLWRSAHPSPSPNRDARSGPRRWLG